LNKQNKKTLAILAVVLVLGFFVVSARFTASIATFNSLDAGWWIRTSSPGTMTNTADGIRCFVNGASSYAFACIELSTSQKILEVSGLFRIDASIPGYSYINMLEFLDGTWSDSAKLRVNGADFTYGGSPSSVALFYQSTTGVRSSALYPIQLNTWYNASLRIDTDANLVSFKMNDAVVGSFGDYDGGTYYGINYVNLGTIYTGFDGAVNLDLSQVTISQGVDASPTATPVPTATIPGSTSSPTPSATPIPVGTLEPNETPTVTPSPDPNQPKPTSNANLVIVAVLGGALAVSLVMVKKKKAGR
jgi:hypothetical protein